MIYVHFTEPPLIYVSTYGGSVGGSKPVLIGLQSHGGDRRACTRLPHHQIGRALNESIACHCLDMVCHGGVYVFLSSCAICSANAYNCAHTFAYSSSGGH